MDQIERKILEDLEDGLSILSSAYVSKYKFKNKDDMYLKLAQMKKDGLIFYKECESEHFKGEPGGKIFITQLGKEHLKEL
ncbi:hypothetical protein [Clostridium cadaveris]|uniref:hypothetical protein n=1 Tax=Clostridium cadaveris TaxID=1529 RepID=UPI000C0888B5|nr:hypothetical protein [Clostridium cadaveris]MDM8312851.1 hypothetical protein [Clostridium cadaveris]